ADIPSVPVAAHWTEPYLLGLEAELLDLEEATAIGLEPLALGANKALNHYSALNSTFPDSYWVSFRKASILLWLDRADAAIEPINHCIEIRPRNPTLYLVQAKILEKLKRYEDAIIACDRSLNLAPGYE